MNHTHKAATKADLLAQFASKSDAGALRRPACPVCDGRLIEIRGKLQCSTCRTICETCCEGGPAV